LILDQAGGFVLARSPLADEVAEEAHGGHAHHDSCQPGGKAKCARRRGLRDDDTEGTAEPVRLWDQGFPATVRKRPREREATKDMKSAFSGVNVSEYRSTRGAPS